MYGDLTIVAPGSNLKNTPPIVAPVGSVGSLTFGTYPVIPRISNPTTSVPELTKNIVLRSFGVMPSSLIPTPNPLSFIVSGSIMQFRIPSPCIVTFGGM